MATATQARWNDEVWIVNRATVIQLLSFCLGCLGQGLVWVGSVGTPYQDNLKYGHLNKQNTTYTANPKYHVYILAAEMRTPL